jgi:uncharacterized membrane protein
MNKNYVPHIVFLYITVVFGILMIVLTPPFQPQDEASHFYRAWQVSSGTFSSIKQNHRLGGYIPRSLEKFYTEFHPFTLNQYNKISPNQLWQTRLIALEPNDTVFIDFTNTALYSAFLYLPQALGIFIGHKFGANPFWLFYFGRLSNLLIFIILVYFAIKIMPFKKWLLVLLASLPLSLTIHSSLSADVLVNSISYLIIAIILNFSFNENIQQLSFKHILVILIFSVLIGLAKLVYVPILFLLVLIPSWKFKSTKVKIGILTVAIFAGIGTAYIQKSTIDSRYIPYSEYNITYRDYTALNKGCDINKQIEFIKEKPKHTIKVFVKSFFSEFRIMVKSYTGILGWEHFNPPNWFIYMAYLIIFFISMFGFKLSTTPDFSLLQRCLIGSIVFVLVVLIMLSQYLSWDLVGENSVYPLIGRYFIPVFPLFFIMLFNVMKIKSNFYSPNAIIKGIFAFCLFSGLLSLYMISIGSYTLNDYTHKKWKASYSFKENENDTNDIEFIISGNDTIAALSKPTGSFISDEKVFTGLHSLKISNKNPYGFTLKIFKGMANDKLVISCRSYGYCSLLDVQEFPNGINFWTSKTYPQKDSLGWKYQEVQFILPHSIEKNNELRVFAWWPYKDSIYLDNYSVTYFEKD